MLHLADLEEFEIVLAEIMHKWGLIKCIIIISLLG